MHRHELHGGALRGLRRWQMQAFELPNPGVRREEAPTAGLQSLGKQGAQAALHALAQRRRRGCRETRQHIQPTINRAQCIVRRKLDEPNLALAQIRGCFLSQIGL